MDRRSTSEKPQVGWLRYCGPVVGASGLWCGVEWDQAVGKYDGEYKGKRYFQCPPMHGSFVQPHKLAIPLSLEDALLSKYSTQKDIIEENAKSVSQMNVNGTDVQFFGVHKTLGHLSGDQLTEASFQGAPITYIGDTKRISSEYPSVSRLDLSGSCLSGLDAFIQVGEAFPALRSVALTNCPLFTEDSWKWIEDNTECIRVAFPELTELFIGGTGASLLCALLLARAIPTLKQVYLNGSAVIWHDLEENGTREVLERTTQALQQGSLSLLSLSESGDTTWSQLSLLAGLPLETLILTGCGSVTDDIDILPSPWLPRLRHISLIRTGVSQWATLEQLFSPTGELAPSLSELRISSVPLLDSVHPGVAHRLVIARLQPCLKTLNQSTPSQRDLRDAVHIYIMSAVKEAMKKPDPLTYVQSLHPRLGQLALTFNRPLPRPLDSLLPGITACTSDDQDFGMAGCVPIVFEFEGETATVDAPVSMHLLRLTTAAARLLGKSREDLRHTPVRVVGADGVSEFFSSPPNDDLLALGLSHGGRIVFETKPVQTNQHNTVVSY